MNIALIEDDLNDQEHLRECLEKYLKSENIDFTLKMYSNISEYELTVPYDLVFVDILVKDDNGFDFAKKIRETYDEKMTSIVFTTTLSQYAIEGYQISAASYILKPFTYEDFVLKTKNVFQKISSRRSEVISLYTRDKKFIKLDLSKILYIESSAHYLTYYTTDGSFEVRQSMSDCEKQLEDKGFFRINSWYLVSLSAISQVLPEEVVIQEKHLSISRARKKAFLEEFTKAYGI